MHLHRFCNLGDGCSLKPAVVDTERFTKRRCKVEDRNLPVEPSSCNTRAGGDEHTGWTVLTGSAIGVFLVDTPDFPGLNRTYRLCTRPLYEKIREMFGPFALIYIPGSNDTVDEP